MYFSGPAVVAQYVHNNPENIQVEYVSLEDFLAATEEIKNNANIHQQQGIE